MGFELADEALVNETQQALQSAESVGDAYALSLARWAHGTALLRSDDAHRAVGIDLLRQSCAGGINSVSIWCDAEFSVELARQGRLDEAIDSLGAAVQSDLNRRDTFFVGYPTAMLVRLLTKRGAVGDRDLANGIVAQLEVQQESTAPAAQLWPLHCRALITASAGDELRFISVLARYRALAQQLDASGHLLLAEQLALEHPSAGNGASNAID
jgi:adenylate cyclase